MRRIAAPILATLLSVAPLGAAAGDAAADPAAPELFPLADVRAGQRGWGLSVFSGDRLERFEVEVLGVMRNVSPDTSYILARLTGRGLEQTGVVAGMSGSPVYLEDRLVGAVSFSWIFSNEAIAGITPIEAMRRLSGGPPPAVAAHRGAPPVGLAELAAAQLPPDLLERQLEVLRPTVPAGARSGLQWSALGFSEPAQGLLRRAVDVLAPAGEAPAGFAGELTPGGSVAGILVDGDLRLAAVGTVTERRGEELLAFGHPFLGLGPVRLPMAPAEVVTVVSNQISSFKVANFGPVAGAFDLDRLAGVRGLIGSEAPMVPLTVAVRGGEPRDFRLRVAEVPVLTPVLVAISALGSLEAASQAMGAQGIDLTARFALAGHGDLDIRQSFDGQQAGLESAIYLLALTGYLLNNTLEDVEIEEIEVELAQAPEPRTAQLVGAHADKTLVRPGEAVAVNLDLVPYRGQPFRRSVEIELPTSLPAGRYSLLVGDGASIDAARLAIERAQPVSFRQALETLRSFHSRREIVVLGLVAGPGLSVAGNVLPQLPGSVRSLWGAAASGSAVPLRLTIAQQEERWLELPVAGAVRIDLEIQRREPVSPTGEEEGEGEAGETTEGEAEGEAPAESPPPPDGARSPKEGGR